MANEESVKEGGQPPCRAADLSSPKDEISCDGPALHLAKGPPGILGTGLDAGRQALNIDYDPRLISDESVRQVAERLAPEAQRRLEKCLLRLGGRACEACALKIEKKTQKIQGVHRATATFIGGVMCVTFDQAVLPSERMVKFVREAGAPVTTFTVPRQLPGNCKEWLEYHRVRLEIGCTGLTLVFMIAGWIAPRLGWEPLWGNTFFVFAY